MSFLCINKFDNDTSEISTGIRFRERCVIHSIRLKVFKCGTLQDGILTLQVLNSNGNLIGSKSLTYEEINNGISGTYAHGYMKFEFSESLVINKSELNSFTECTLKVVMSDHTEDQNNYIALVRDENPYTPEYGERPVNEPNNVWFNPYGLEIYSVSK
tara:strand:- start:2722 stop:3195 length:474 start_codon:yes stop_codon:yes gene_type:complete